jgi:NitT/TauT family transport system substrate-binding protein
MYYQKTLFWRKVLKNKFLNFFMAAFISAIMPISFLIGCTNDGSVLRINEVTHSVFYAPLYLAESLGYFEDEGIKIQLTNGGGADSTMAAILSDSADIGFCGPEAAIYVNVGGSTDTPYVFGQLTKRDGSFLVGRVKQDNFDWSALSGKEILAGRYGGVPAMVFEYTLKNLGIEANLNYDVSFNMMTSAFQGGVADYCTMFEPTASQFEESGNGYILASVGQQSGEIPYTCFIAKDSYIKANSTKIEGFLRAVTRAIKYVNETDSQTVASYLVSYFDGTGKDALATSIERYKSIDAWVTNMALERQAFERLQDIIESCGQLDERVEYSSMVTTTIADSVYRQVYGI